MNRDQRKGLVAYMPNPDDLNIANTQHWYRLPVTQVKHSIKRRWPPQWIAFYLPKIFGSDAFTVRYWADITTIHKVKRSDLFPEEHHPKKGQKEYYKLGFSSLNILENPVPSDRYRRLLFIPTTWKKLINADEINDLWDDSPLEDALWSELKRLDIPAIRQHPAKADGAKYVLDFAIYCVKGKIDIETDGDTWHTTKEGSRHDNIRDNALETKGWRTIRFTTQQVRKEMMTYCLPTIAQNINHLGGINIGNTIISRKFKLQGSNAIEQLRLL